VSSLILRPESHHRMTRRTVATRSKEASASRTIEGDDGCHQLLEKTVEAVGSLIVAGVGFAGWTRVEAWEGGGKAFSVRS
jgi:hypothetical protein